MISITSRYGVTALAALAGLGMLAAASPATAATTINGVYFDATTWTRSHSAPSCETVNFAPVPTNKILFIQQVSCTIVVLSTARIGNVEFRRKNGTATAGYQKLTPVLLSDVSGKANYQVNNHVMLMLAEGNRPNVFVGLRASSAPTTLTCTIHGFLQNEPV